MVFQMNSKFVWFIICKNGEGMNVYMRKTCIK